MPPLSTAIVGCGNIAAAYARQLASYPEIRIAGFQDPDSARAGNLVTEYGGKVYPTLEAVLAEPEVDLLVNLTPASEHERITRSALLAGKHVHSEKPISLTPQGAADLAAVADRVGRRLSCAPVTFLGDAQQKVSRLLADNRCGTIRWVCAEINQGRIESWHPDPRAFYEVGVLWDVGVYPLTLLCSFLGPISSVRATQHLLLPDRTDKSRRPFHFERPECTIAILEFSCGAVARLSCNFYALHSRQGSSIEFHGDQGSIFLGSSFLFDAEVHYGSADGPMELVSPEQPPFEGVEFARGIQVLARCINENIPHPTSASLAAHVVAVLAAIEEASSRCGAPVPVPHGSFSQP